MERGSLLRYPTELTEAAKTHEASNSKDLCFLLLRYRPWMSQVSYLQDFYSDPIEWKTTQEARAWPEGLGFHSEGRLF